MSWVFALVIVARLIWWVIQSQSAPRRVTSEEAAPADHHPPQRPRLGGYGIATPDEHEA